MRGGKQSEIYLSKSSDLQWTLETVFRFGGRENRSRFWNGEIRTFIGTYDFFSSPSFPFILPHSTLIPPAVHGTHMANSWDFVSICSASSRFAGWISNLKIPKTDPNHSATLHLTVQARSIF